jgi:predicted ATP-dependent protease
MNKTRSERAAALETWAENVGSEDLVEVDTAALKAIAAYAEQSAQLDDSITQAVRDARRAGRSWSEIASMLGVSKQAAQRKYVGRCAGSPDMWKAAYLASRRTNSSVNCFR